jgi:putative oxidoreductase
MDIGILILRVAIGGLVAAHGAQKLFGWFGGHGLEGTGGFFAGLGFRPARAMAFMAGMTEFGGGLSLLFGFLTPLGAAAIVGVMTTAALSAHWPKGLWNTNGGYELPLTYAIVAIAVAMTGPGAYSADARLGIVLSGPMVGLWVAAVGVLSGIAMNGWRVAGRRAATVHEMDRGRDTRAA